jgi:hypothetical protein
MPIDVCQQEQLETVWNQLDLSQGVIKRPLLADRYGRSRLAWCLARRKIRCYPWCAGSWQVFHIIGLCVFSHQSADYSIVVAHLTSSSFEGHPCCMHADYLPSLCFWYSPSYHAYWEWIKILKHYVKDLPRSAKPRVTSDRDDRALQRLVRRMPFATSPVIK